jgi:hypothetical protein
MTAPTKPTEDLTWASATLTNGASNTQNKVEPSTDHKTDGFTFPEQPPRNYWNYWMNGVWKWFVWATKWIDNAGRLADNFAQDIDGTSGLTFAYFGGNLFVDTSTGGTNVSIASGTFLLTGSSTTHIYIDLSDNAIKQSTTGIPSITAGAVLLYVLTTDGSGITSTADRRTFAREVARATNTEAQTGTDTNKFITPASLASVTTTPTRAGLTETATQAEVDTGTDTVRQVTPATLKGAADIIRRDGSVIMTAPLDMGSNAVVLRNDGGSDKNYLEFDNGANAFNLVDSSALGATGNATLNLGKLLTAEVKCTKTVSGSVSGTDQFYMRDASTNLIKPATKTAVKSFLGITDAIPGFLYGLGIANGADLNNDIDISLGKCVDSTGSTLLNSSGTITKKINASWIAGSGNGGYASSSSLASNTWYRIFLIAKADGTVDAGFDVSSTASNLLAAASGFIVYRQIGWVRYHTTGIYRFFQDGDRFTLDGLGALNFNYATDNSVVTLTAPPLTYAIVSVQAGNPSNAGSAVTYWHQLNESRRTNIPASSQNFCVQSRQTGLYTELSMDCAEVTRFVDSASQIIVRSTGVGLCGYTLGWLDTRGR